MAKFRIYRSFGYVGTEDSEVIEAENEDEAHEQARDYAMERVEYWAEQMDEGEEE